MLVINFLKYFPLDCRIKLHAHHTHQNNANQRKVQNDDNNGSLYSEKNTYTAAQNILFRKNCILFSKSPLCCQKIYISFSLSTEKESVFLQQFPFVFFFFVFGVLLFSKIDDLMAVNCWQVNTEKNTRLPNTMCRTCTHIYYH